MLKAIKKKTYRNKTTDLKTSPGEAIRDEIINLGIKAVQESGYSAGNTTEKLINIADKAAIWVDKTVDKAGIFVDRGTQLIGGGEASNALGTIVFKTTKDIARGDTVCTGLCLVSGTCEMTALLCSTVKVIPFRGKIYVGTKIVSKALMAYRNACAGEGC